MDEPTPPPPPSTPPFSESEVAPTLASIVEDDVVEELQPPVLPQIQPISETIGDNGYGDDGDDDIVKRRKRSSGKLFVW
jgi:hypothetical protein